MWRRTWCAASCDVVWGIVAPGFVSSDLVWRIHHKLTTALDSIIQTISQPVIAHPRPCQWATPLESMRQPMSQSVDASVGLQLFASTLKPLKVPLSPIDAMGIAQAGRPRAGAPSTLAGSKGSASPTRPSRAGTVPWAAATPGLPHRPSDPTLALPRGDARVLAAGLESGQIRTAAGRISGEGGDLDPELLELEDERQMVPVQQRVGEEKNKAGEKERASHMAARMQETFDFSHLLDNTLQVRPIDPYYR